MCDTLTLLDGSEVHTVAEAIVAGILTTKHVRDHKSNGFDPMFDCLCYCGLEQRLEDSGRHWRRGGFGWYECDDEGRNYWEHGLMPEPSQSVPGVVTLVANPDYPYHSED